MTLPQEAKLNYIEMGERGVERRIKREKEKKIEEKKLKKREKIERLLGLCAFGACPWSSSSIDSRGVFCSAHRNRTTSTLDERRSESVCYPLGRSLSLLRLPVRCINKEPGNDTAGASTTKIAMNRNRTENRTKFRATKRYESGGMIVRCSR